LFHKKVVAIRDIRFSIRDIRVQFRQLQL